MDSLDDLRGTLLDYLAGSDRAGSHFGGRSTYESGVQGVIRSRQDLDCNGKKGADAPKENWTENWTHEGEGDDEADGASEAGHVQQGKGFAAWRWEEGTERARPE